MRCKLCNERVRLSKWYDLFPLFPFDLAVRIISEPFLHRMRNTKYRHEKGIFTKCEAIFLPEDLTHGN